MSDPRPPAGPVDPLTGDLTTVTILGAGITRPVDGKLVAPGLAMTPAPGAGYRPGNPRYNLTHVPSGAYVVSTRCGAHIRDAADMAVGTGIDWTIPAAEVTEAIRALDLDRLVRARIGVCRRWHCAGDPPTPHADGTIGGQTRG